ncbi:hypothetical protein CSA56_08860 [candidate division KSB3 bacterium]|uniref:NACHT domain-containing protein n=1 Tax=candidate division KSB3 bacterium TaxID=2044937 RepID=A0A2G6KEC8_9BACT|nr:MAG: hypothetical protein CSA56_08860 [candidate division KSB3 bacterium]
MYLSRLFQQTSQLPLSVVDRQATSSGIDSRLRLDAIYTALITRGGGQEHVRDEKDAEERRFSALEQVNRHRHLVLLGDPGSGKSTFVKFTAMCLAGELLGETQANLTLLTAPLPQDQKDDNNGQQPEPQCWTQGALLPVLVILRDFAARTLPPANQPGTARHLWEFLEEELRAAMLDDYVQEFRQHVQQHESLLLLDGLDEVPEASQRRSQIKQVVEDFAASFPKCRILVTSRTYAYQRQEWQLCEFQDTVLAPFTQPQIRCFIDHWYDHLTDIRGLNPEDARGRAELLKRVIFQSERLYNFAERPLLLTLMASLHACRGGSLPEKREELYNDSVELLLDWWESPKIVRDSSGKILITQESLTELLKVGKECVREALNDLAFHVHHDQPDLVGTADIAQIDLVDRLMRLQQRKDLQPGRLLEYLSDRAGLLVPRGVGIFSFPHRSFQEYLAACYLTDEDYPDQIADLARQEPNRWREVALLAGAKASRGTAAAIWLLAGALCYKPPGREDSGKTRRSPSRCRRDFSFWEGRGVGFGLAGHRVVSGAVRGIPDGQRSEKGSRCCFLGEGRTTTAYCHIGGLSDQPLSSYESAVPGFYRR